MRAALVLVPSLTRRSSKRVYVCARCPYLSNTRNDLVTHGALHKPHARAAQRFFLKIYS